MGTLCYTPWMLCYTLLRGNPEEPPIRLNPGLAPERLFSPQSEGFLTPFLTAPTDRLGYAEGVNIPVE